MKCMCARYFRLTTSTVVLSIFYYFYLIFKFLLKYMYRNPCGRVDRTAPAPDFRLGYTPYDTIQCLVRVGISRLNFYCTIIKTIPVFQFTAIRSQILTKKFKVVAMCVRVLSYFIRRLLFGVLLSFRGGRCWFFLFLFFLRGCCFRSSL